LHRRRFLKGLLAVTLAGLFVSLYGLVIEPMLRLRVATWKFSPATWRKGHKLRIAIVTDLHMGEPYMGLARLRKFEKALTGWGRILLFCCSIIPVRTGSVPEITVVELS